MQNNPFNLLSQLQSAAAAAGTANASNSPDGSGQPGWNNAALMGAMQSMLSRGNSTAMPNLAGVAQQTWPNKAPGGSDSSVDMNLFRQFQLQQNQPQPSGVSPPQRAAGVSGAPATSTTPASTAAWNNPSLPGWNNPQLASGAASGSSSNPLMNMMVQSLISQQMAMQQAQPQNPFMQMMQTMMPMATAMPAVGAPLPNMDPNMAKQMLVQLVGQLQATGQLNTDDSVQKLLQQVGGSAQGTENVIVPPADVISIQPDGSEEQCMDEPVSVPVTGKKAIRGPKAKGAGAQSVATPESRGRQTKKAIAISVDTIGTERGLGQKSAQKPGPLSRANDPSNKIPDLVMLDSDDEDDPNSGIVEESKAKKGRGAAKAKPQPRQAKKSTNATSKVTPKITKDSAKPIVPDFPLQRIKVEDVNDEEPVAGPSRSPRRGKNPVTVSEKAAEEIVPIATRVKADPDAKPVCIPSGVNLKQCEIRLERLKRDTSGKFIIPLNLNMPPGTEKTLTTFKVEPRIPIFVDPSLAKKKDDQPPPINVQLLPNLNAVVHPQMRTIFVGHLNGNMQWLSLIGWAASRSFCQCPFCPILSDTPKPILSHIRTEHADLTFALTKMKPPTGKYLYLFCRHCDFVAVDVTINWLHFEVYHNVSDILEGTARPRIEDFAPAKLEIRRGLEDIMDTIQSYMCYDCELISDDSKQVAIHVLHEHPNTPHYNGCFVKLLGLRKPLKTENVSYKHVISDEEFAEFRQEAFICMMCDYIAHCPYMALSHNLITHQTKRVLFECMEAGCNFNCITDYAMIQHLSSKHRLKADLCCSTTLLEPRVEGYLECVITVNRKSSKQASLQRCHPPIENADADGGEGEDGEDEEPEDDESDEEEEEEPKKKKKKKKAPARPKAKAPKKSPRKAAVENGKKQEEDEEDPDDEDMEIDKLPDDVKITVNPPSPDDEDDLPGSPDSGDTIVEDQAEDEENGLSPIPEADDTVSQDLPSDSGDVEDATNASEAEAGGTQSGSGDDVGDGDDAGAGDDVGGVEEDPASVKDFMADIPMEPCCLSPDIYLPVPNADICTFDSGPGAEEPEKSGTGGSSLAQQLDTPEKTLP